MVKILKLPPRKLESQYVPQSFFLLRLLCISINLPYTKFHTYSICMEYCCHIWDGAPSCYLKLLDKLQIPICRTVGPSLAASLEPLAHRRNCYASLWNSLPIECFPLTYLNGFKSRINRLHLFHEVSFSRGCSVSL